MEKPPADPRKLLSAWAEVTAGEVTPGRGLSNLKTAGLPDVLTACAADPSALPDDIPAAEVLAAWMTWEEGSSPPLQVVAALADRGLGPLLDALATAEAPEG